MITSMNLIAVKEICSWQYEPPYDVYNYFSFDEAVKNNSPLLKEENRDNYICFWENETLIAYLHIYRIDDRIFFGIGICPAMCSKGLGKNYLKKGIEVASELYPDSEIWVQVRSWNIRAIKCYKSCGFKEKYREAKKDRFGKNEEFIFMSMENI